MRRILVSLLTFISLSVFADDYGTVSYKDIELSIEDIFVTYEPDRNRLQIYLFPFQLSLDERNSLQENLALGKLSLVTAIKAPERWDSWTPQADVSLIFDDENKLTSYAVNTHHFTSLGHNYGAGTKRFHRIRIDEIGFELGEKVAIVLSDEFDDLKWDFSLNGEIESTQ